MKFEIKRKIDKLGRIGIPIDFRNYYEIKCGDTIVLLAIRNGIQIAKSDLFIPELTPKETTVSVDKLGRIVIPQAFRQFFNLKPQDTIHIVPNETCISIYKN